MKQFGRRYKLEIGNNKETISFSDLRLTFSVIKTISSEPNPAEIQIANLNQSHRDLIASKQYNYVRLYVAYVTDDLRLIFSGDVVKSETIRNGLNFITKLSCADGYEAYTDTATMTTLSAGATDNDVVNHAMEKMGVEKGSINLPNDRALPRGKVMVCDARDLMKKVAVNNNADWSIQDGQIVVLPKTHALKNDEGFILSQSTGMVGSPRKSTTGIEVDALLNPHFKIGGLVRIESIIKSNNGDYKITKITHSGDIHGNTWNTHLVCEIGEYTT